MCCLVSIFGATYFVVNWAMWSHAIVLPLFCQFPSPPAMVAHLPQMSICFFIFCSTNSYPTTEISPVFRGTSFTHDYKKYITYIKKYVKYFKKCIMYIKCFCVTLARHFSFSMKLTPCRHLNKVQDGDKYTWYVPTKMTRNSPEVGDHCFIIMLLS